MKHIKTLLIATVMAVSTASTLAQPRHHHNSSRDIAIGMAIGSIGTALIYQNQQRESVPVYVAPPVHIQPNTYVAPPVYIQPPVVYGNNLGWMTYNPRTGLWVDQAGREWTRPQ